MKQANLFFNITSCKIFVALWST